MLSTKPFNSILDLIKVFPTEQSCIDHLTYLRWSEEIVSPFDITSQVYICKDNKYKCRNTGKYFNVRTGSIFEGTKIPLQQWFLAIYLFTNHKKGISSYQLAEDLKITQKTAWFMLSRIRYAMEHEEFFKSLSEDSIEIDETFVGGKNKNRHKDKKVKNSQGRSFKDKTPVLGILQSGNIKTTVIADTKAETIQPIIYKTIETGANINTDEWWAYKGLNNDYNHNIVDHGKGQYVNGDITTNRIENAWSHFKRTIFGTYHFVSRKHLQKYCNEFDFRFNTKYENVEYRFNSFLLNVNNKRLTYNNLKNG
jgi:transposase-like protein